MKALQIDRKDINKLINEKMTVEEYAEKYQMKIDHVKNFKNLYLMIDKVGGEFAQPEENFILETLQKKINKVRMFAENSSAQIIKRVEAHPKVSTVIVFSIGLICGVLLGTAISKRK